MNIEPDTSITVDVNTDDLDSFTDLFNGKTPEVANETVPEDKVDEPTEDENTESNEDTSADAPDEDDNPEDKESEKPKKVNRFQERINELTAKAREAERREAELQKRLEEIAAKQVEPVKPETQTKAQELPDPDTKNADGTLKYPLGEFDPAYIRDLNRAIIEEERKAYREQEDRERVARQEQEQRDAIHNQWTAKLETVTEQHEDFLDKTIELESTFEGLDAQYSDYLVQTIKSLDHGPEVLYYFANNLEEAKKFVQMGPLAATLALGEYNAMFKGSKNKETKVSKAPPPPQLNKGSNVRKTVTGDTDDLDAFSDVFFKK